LNALNPKRGCRTLRPGLLHALSLCLLLVALTACRSTQPASASFASVLVTGSSPAQASEMIQQVFHEQGFITARASFSHIVLEKEGSGWNNFVYGNWTDKSPTWIRVKADVVPISQTVLRLQCNAFMLRDRLGLTEEEIKISNMRAGKYQKLLDEAARRLKP